MRLNFTLISAFFASAVLADRSLEHRSPLEKRTNATFDSRDVIYSNWAGATLSQSSPSFYEVSGTFEVPNPSGPIGSGVNILVGIDGVVGKEPYLQAGVVCTMSPDGPLCIAIAEWYPDSQRLFTDIEVSPGDTITVTVSVTSGLTDGYAKMGDTKKGTDQPTFQTLDFSGQPALGGLSAEWIVSKVGRYDLANFGVVSFSKAVALGQYNQPFTPAESLITEIQENGLAVTSAFANETVVKIRHT